MSYDTKAIVSEIDASIKKYRDEIIGIRRHLHQYPELSWKETKTAQTLTELLKETVNEVIDGICETAVIANLRKTETGKTIAIRADMDALPLHDVKNVEYASRIPGVMHACGHDCHMAMAIGVARVLTNLKIELPGNVRFIFQPSEEAIPSGASELVKSGAMDNVDAILAFHVDPEIQAGKIGLRSGILTAHCSEFKLTINGKSGHAARPHRTVDTVFLSTQILSSLYSIISSRSNPFIPAVLTIGKIEAGTKANIIPDTARIYGTIRTIDDKSLQEIKTAIEERLHSITRAASGSYQLEFLDPIPSVYNDNGMINMVSNIAGKLIGKNNIITIDKVSMGGEDFAWYLQKAPGALIRLGTGKKNQEITYLHSSNFDIDENALLVGVKFMSMIVIKYLLGNQLVL